MKQTFFYSIMILLSSQTLAQSDCEKCFQSVESVYKGTFYEMFDLQSSKGLYVDFKSFFYSEDFETWARSHNSAPFKVPTPLGGLNFGSGSTQEDWQKRTTIIKKDMLTINYTFWVNMVQLNPSFKMAEKFNESHAQCASSAACSGKVGNVAYLEKMSVNENSVTVVVAYAPPTIGFAPPTIKALNFDPSLFSLVRPVVGKKLNMKGTTIILKKNPAIAWSETFFSVDLDRGVNTVYATVPAFKTTGVLFYKYPTGRKIEKCEQVVEAPFQNPGLHDTKAKNFTRHFLKKDGFFEYYVEPSGDNDYVRVDMVRILGPVPGYYFKDATINIANDYGDAQRRAYSSTLIQYFDIMSKETTPSQTGDRVEIHSRLYSNPLDYQISYAKCQSVDEIKSNEGDNTVVISRNTASVKVPANATDVQVMIPYRSRVYPVNLDRPNTDEIAHMFKIEEKIEGGMRNYTIIISSMVGFTFN